MSACALTHQVVPYDGTDPSAHGAVYYLPKTLIDVKLPITKKTTEPGPLRRFVPEVSKILPEFETDSICTAAKTTFTVGQPLITSRTVPDPKNAYSVILYNWNPFLKRDFSAVLNESGFLTSASTKNEDQTIPVLLEVASLIAKVAESAALTANIETTTAKLTIPPPETKMIPTQAGAEKIAKKIRKLECDKDAILCQQSSNESSPTLQLCLAAIDQRIKGLKELFTGTTTEAPCSVVLEYEPTADTSDISLGVLDKELGFYPAVNSHVRVRSNQDQEVKHAPGRDPLPLALSILPTRPGVPKCKDKGCEAGFRYCLPAMATVQLKLNDVPLVACDMPIAQLGTTVCLPRGSGSLIGTSYKVTLDAQHGGLRSIDTSSEAVTTQNVDKMGDAVNSLVSAQHPAK